MSEFYVYFKFVFVYVNIEVGSKRDICLYIDVIGLYWYMYN